MGSILGLHFWLQWTMVCFAQFRRAEFQPCITFVSVLAEEESISNGVQSIRNWAWLLQQTPLPVSSITASGSIHLLSTLHSHEINIAVFEKEEGCYPSTSPHPPHVKAHVLLNRKSTWSNLKVNVLLHEVFNHVGRTPCTQLQFRSPFVSEGGHLRGWSSLRNTS